MVSDKELRDHLRYVMIQADHHWPGNLERRLDMALAVFREHAVSAEPTPERHKLPIAPKSYGWKDSEADLSVLARIIDDGHDDYQPFYDRHGKCISSDIAYAIQAAGFRRVVIEAAP